MIDKRILIGTVFSIVAISAALTGCKKDATLPTKILSCGTPYELDLPQSTPPMPMPEDNPLTVEGIELGRHLFYETKLSGDNTMACASCHQQQYAFAEDTKFSTGIDGFEGTRNAMPIFNVGWSEKLFWDGKANSLEELVLFPIESEVEMHESVFKAVKKLQETEKYPQMFYQAYCDSTISVETMSKALAQFMRSVISYNYRSLPGIGNEFRNEIQRRGFEVFVDENKGDCFHCHTVTTFVSNFQFENNGLNEDPSTDPGLYGQTGNPADMGKFKIPSLLNLRHTAPYMHDGRFETLEEVLNFYDTGFHVSSTLSIDLRKHTKDGKPVPRTWTEQDKRDLIIFLQTLDDPELLNNPKYAKPTE